MKAATGNEAGLGGTPAGASQPEAPGDQTERARRWAATMAGHSWSGIRLAHADSHATASGDRCAGPGPVARAEREEREDAALAPGATRARGAGRRAREELPDLYRTCFERDRDRILHSTAFRRLAGKTQVFIFPLDHQRTRLTHALEVAQVATSIARATRLNVTLSEAIALGHDCGHGPGGHASEDALSPFVAGGFDHAVWGADVALADLNLCEETLDGIRNHSWSRPAPATPEGEVVSWADRIAYVCHDFEDAVRAQIVTPQALPPSVRRLCGTTRSSQLRAFITDVIAVTTTTGAIGMSEEMATALADLRRVNYDRIYLRPDSTDQARSVHRLLGALVEHFARVPPGERAGSFAPAAGDLGSDAALASAVTYVAGMTDRFACATARRELGWAESDLPAGVDLPPSRAPGPTA